MWEAKMVQLGEPLRLSAQQSAIAGVPAEKP